MSERLEEMGDSGGCNHSGRIVDIHAEVIRCGCGDYSITLRDYVEEHFDLLVQGERLREAVERLYYAAYWTADREVDAIKLWEDVRDAAGLTPGKSIERLGPPRTEGK